MFWNYLKENTIEELARNEELIKGYVALAIISALMGFLSILFTRVSISFFSQYMLGIGFTILGIGTVERAFVILMDALSMITECSKIAVPIYLITMALASSQTLAGIYGQLFSMVIYWIEMLWMQILGPFSRLYGLVGMMDSLWMDGKMQGIPRLFKKITKVTVKTIVCGITAFGYIQNQVLSISLEVEKSTVGTLISLIPGVGKLAEESLSLLIGSSVLIYRTTGVFVILLLGMICLKPLIQLGLLYLTLLIGEGVFSLLTDGILLQGMEHAKASHLVEGMHILVAAVELMLVILFWAICFFVLMIAVVSIR